MTCLRYFLAADGSLEAREEPGRCGEWWRLRWQALHAIEEGGAREAQIKLRLHEERCEVCGHYFRESEFYSRGQDGILHEDGAERSEKI